MIAALGLLASCDPVQSEKDFDPIATTAEELDAAITFAQYSKTDSVTPQADGNWITYKTSPEQIVTIFNLDADGNENVLAYGKTHGGFMLSPKRGSSNEQKIYVRVLNSDGTKVDVERTLTVDVPSEMAENLKFLCSNEGTKTWKWNASAPGGYVWGNMGNWSGTDFDGKDFALNGGAWWGVTDASELLEQLNHAVGGVAHGDESMDATMVFSEDGTITCYDADGKEFRKGKFSVTDYDPTYSNNKEYMGILHTDAGSILFPYEINAGGNEPTWFYIAYMDATHLVLMYPDTGEWNSDKSNEGTFWQFTSTTDLVGALTDNSEATWTWDDESGQCWGNGGYGSFVYGGSSSLTGGSWWGIPSTDLGEQVTSYGYGFADVNGTTMTFQSDGTLTKSTGGKGTFAFDSKTTTDIGGFAEGTTWGRLTTTGDGILFPVRINAGTTTNEFDVVYFDSDHLVLAYPNYPKGSTSSDGSDAASWMEGTFWRFKKVK